MVERTAKIALVIIKTPNFYTILLCLYDNAEMFFVFNIFNFYENKKKLNGKKRIFKTLVSLKKKTPSGAQSV